MLSSLVTTLEQMMWMVILMPTMGYMAISCFLENNPPQNDFACSILFTVWMMQLGVTLAGLAVLGFVGWLGWLLVSGWRKSSRF